MLMLTLRSLFPVPPHSTAAGPPICGQVPELSVCGGGRGGLKYSCWHQTFKQNGNELTVSLMVMLVVMLVVMSAANLAKMSVTMARLPVVCSCSLAAAPLTAPLTAMTASS